MKQKNTMKQVFKFIVATSLLFPCVVTQGQTDRLPKFAYVASGSSGSIPTRMLRVTNYNSSVYLGDSVLSFPVDSLRTDKTATIITVYETDADKAVGLWQVGSGTNRSLWLNSQRVSYDDYAVTYRINNEKGVVIHTMRYQYPTIDDTYNGHDTIFLGREGELSGEKNLCALYYYPGHLTPQYQKQLESALAIRYGALLHGPYINSHTETIWDTKGDDSPFSVGVCGIGRDDAFSLLQPRSVIRGDILSLETVHPLADLDHIMLGCDSNSLCFGHEITTDGNSTYLSLARHWRLRSHTNQGKTAIRLYADLAVPAHSIRLMLTSVEGTVMYTPSEKLVFDNITLVDGIDYEVSIFVNSTMITNGAIVKEENTTNNSLQNNLAEVQVSPNPTSGHFTVKVNQSEEDLVNIRVVDVHGRTIEEHTTDQPLSQYVYNGQLTTDGIYYVTVTSNGQQKTVKLIVVR